jgi:hypothetical protein
VFFSQAKAFFFACTHSAHKAKRKLDRQRKIFAREKQMPAPALHIALFPKAAAEARQF